MAQRNNISENSKIVHFGKVQHDIVHKAIMMKNPIIVATNAPTRPAVSFTSGSGSTHVQCEKLPIIESAPNDIMKVIEVKMLGSRTIAPCGLFCKHSCINVNQIGLVQTMHFYMYLTNNLQPYSIHNDIDSKF